MNEEVYSRIREDNIRKYGTDISRYGPTLLANLYNDTTHFIYELLQNAEDACERACKAGAKGEFIIEFSLFNDRLEIKHNGIPFDKEDVQGICGIVEGTKKDDISQIGKFGIGFKSVYAFTKSPEIYSEEWCFQIKDYVHPYPLRKRTDIENKKTLFVIPFNHDEVSKEISFAKIKKRLQDLDVRNLLFLRNISEITWNIGGEKGHYLRGSTDVDKNISRVTLLWDTISLMSEKDKSSEEWMVFHRPLRINGKDACAEIAFKLLESKIIPFNDAKLAAFFLTDKDTYLKFIIQGPYKTTPARDNIPLEDDTNKALLSETATLVSDTISRVKNMGMLDVSFLSTLPLEAEKVSDENTIYSCIYNSVKKKLLSEEALLPTNDGGHIDSRNALLARGKELLDLLSPSQLGLMFKRVNASWLDENITIDKTRVLRDYLMNELNIIEVDPEKFSREFAEDFIKAQTDDWVRKFYGFLSGRKELWREKVSYYIGEGALRSKPIIRLTDNKHIQPFNSSGEANVYLPGGDEARFLTVKKCLIDDEKAKEFLHELGLREPDVIDDIIKNVLSKYGMFTFSEVGLEENMQDVKYICETLVACTAQERKDKLLNALKERYFLRAKRFGDKDSGYKKPSEVYFGQVYTNSNLLNQYFEGNQDTWFLDECYVGIFDVDFFEQLGCKDEITINYRNPDKQGHVLIAADYGHHKRGLDGFDPECSIDGLENSLRNINLEKSKIIWNLVRRFHKSIKGVVETSSRQGYPDSNEKTQFSKMGALLVKYLWLPVKVNGKIEFHEPSTVKLSFLPEGFDKESLEAKYVARQLEFKPDVEQELLTQLPEGRKKVFELVDMLCQNLSAEDVESKLSDFVEKLLEQAGGRKPEASFQDVKDKFKESLENKQATEPSDDIGGAWGGMDPEEEEDVRQNYGNGLLDKLKKAELKQDVKITKHGEISGSLDPKEFLFEQYKGHCQLCNTLLNLGVGKPPYFEIYRIVETRNKHAWSNMEFNVLCLCPNCHALIKHGGADLKEVLVVAAKVSKNEIAPEEVNEKQGDFYIIDVEVVGQKRQIFYTSTHMMKVAAFVEKR